MGITIFRKTIENTILAVIFFISGKWYSSIVCIHIFINAVFYFLLIIGICLILIGPGKNSRIRRILQLRFIGPGVTQIHRKTGTEENDRNHEGRKHQKSPLLGFGFPHVKTHREHLLKKGL